MEWWVKALATILGTSTFFYSVHRWNDHYRQQDKLHPITAFLAKHINDSEEDRQRRIRDIANQSALSEKRLEIMYRGIPTALESAKSTYLK